MSLDWTIKTSSGKAWQMVIVNYKGKRNHSSFCRNVKVFAMDN